MNAEPLLEAEITALRAAHARHLAGAPPAAGDGQLLDRVLGRVVIVLVRDAAREKPSSADVLRALGASLAKLRPTREERWQLVSLLASPLLADVRAQLGGGRR